MLIMIYLLRNRKEWSMRDFYTAAFLMTYTCVFFLPAMHERYSYCYLILGLFLCFLDRKMLPVFLVLLAIDLTTYSNYLFPLNPSLPRKTVALFNCICYAASVCYVVFCHFGKPGKKPVRL